MARKLLPLAGAGDVAFFLLPLMLSIQQRSCRFSVGADGLGQSPVLREVDLTVSSYKYKHKKMFGTLVKKNKDGEPMDPCSGDSGGPLMYYEEESRRYVVIGQFPTINSF